MTFTLSSKKVGIPLVKKEVIIAFWTKGKAHAKALRGDDSWMVWKEGQGGVEQRMRGG